MKKFLANVKDVIGYGLVYMGIGLVFGLGFSTAQFLIQLLLARVIVPLLFGG